MAFFDSKAFNAEAFGKYMDAIPNPKMNKLKESRAVVGDRRLREVFGNVNQTGTVYALIPYFGLIGGTPQNYDGEHDLTSERTKTFTQGVFTFGRMQSWTEADFSYDVTGGVDFMSNIRSQIKEYWGAVDQNVLLSVLKGIFGMGSTLSGRIRTANTNFVNNHTYNIAQGDADAATTPEMCVSATTLNNAIQQACGDHKGKFSLVIMHSAVATNLENMNLLTNLKYTDAAGVQRDLGLGTWNGRLVIIDDSMPTETKNVGETGGDVSLYTTYILGEGAIGWEDVGAKVPYEMARDPRTKGGEDTLINRKRNAISVAGISYLKAHQATNSPEDTELENGLNWSLINDGADTVADKTIPIARIISRG